MIYDTIIPFGTSCIVADVLTELRLRKCSYPFDWIGGGDMKTRAQLLINNFNDWFNQDDFIEIPFINDTQRIYKDYLNVKTNMTFRHHFTKNKSDKDEFLKEYIKLKEKYERRQKRLFNHLMTSENVLLLTIETPTRPKIRYSSELDYIHSILSSKFCNVQIDLLYFRLSDNHNLKIDAINEHITVVSTNYSNSQKESNDIKHILFDVFKQKEIMLK